MDKFVLCADLHIRSNLPRYRRDKSYLDTALRKFRQIIDIANYNDADLICAGDLFDSVRVSHKVVNCVIELIRKLDHQMFIVTGQHDRLFHSDDLLPSPIQTLLYQDNISLLNREAPIQVKGEKSETWLYGCSFEEEPVKPAHEDSLLVIHKSITPEEPPFFLEDAISADDALDKWEGYFLIVSGDYHHPFVAEKWSNVLVNCGPMLRNSTDQFDLKPRVYLADMIDKSVEPIFLDVEDPEKVFKVEELESKITNEEDTAIFAEELKALVEDLKKESKRPSYSEVVETLMEKSGVDSSTKNLVRSIMKEAKENG